MPIFFRIILLLLLTGGSWFALEHSKIVPPFKDSDALNERQRRMVVEFLELNIPSPTIYLGTSIQSGFCFNNDPDEMEKPCPRRGLEAPYGELGGEPLPADMTDRIDKDGNPRLSANQQAAIGSLSTMREVPWWLWRTGPDEMTYGGYNWYLANLQEHVLAAAVVGFLINLFCRFSLKIGWFWPMFIAVVLPITLSGLYLSPNMNETLSFFTLMFSLSILLTLWPYQKPDPDYKTK